MKLIEKIYSDAFEEGFDYAIEKMFARKFVNPKNIKSIARKKDNGLLSDNGKGFYNKIKTAQPKTVTIAGIDSIPF